MPKQKTPVNFLLQFALLALAAPALAQTASGPAFAPPSSSPVTINGFERELKRGDIEVYARVSGIATAQDTYDVLAPFDGRVEEVMAELFDFVTPEKTAANIVSVEMAALIDSSQPQDRKQAERRWQDVYQYYPIKPESQGIVSGVFIHPKDKVVAGDRLFTIARKVVVIGKNTEPLYSKLTLGAPAEMSYARDSSVKLKTVLAGFVQVQDSPLYSRLWLAAPDLSAGIRIGERFNGYLFVGRSENALLVPRKALIEKNGAKYLILEMETGLATKEETEIIRSGLHFMSPAEQPYGKDKKTK